MKKRLGMIGLVLVIVCVVVALYWYVDHADKKDKSKSKTAVEQLLERDLKTNYPPTPYSVAELWCMIIEGTYASNTSEEQLSSLIDMERELFDSEFAAINPKEQLLEATKDELSLAAEQKTVFSGYVLDKSSNVERWKKDGSDYASISVQFATRSSGGSANGYRLLIMRKDSAGRYKILGWQTEED